MAEKFGVKTGHYDSTATRPLVILSQPLLDLVTEMCGMFTDFSSDVVWVVQLLATEARPAVGNLPVAQSPPRAVPLMKLQV
jgi:hypothetical protein